MYSDRIPGFYSGDVAMSQRRHNKFYSERQKYKELLRSQENRRHRKWKKRYNDDDIVKTGSEEENERPLYRKRKSRRKSIQKRDDELLASIERRERILMKAYMENRDKSRHFLSPKDTKDEREYKYDTSRNDMSRIPTDVYRENPHRSLVPNVKHRQHSNRYHSESKMYTGHLLHETNSTNNLPTPSVPNRHLQLGKIDDTSRSNVPNYYSSPRDHGDYPRPHIPVNDSSQVVDYSRHFVDDHNFRSQYDKEYSGVHPSHRDTNKKISEMHSLPNVHDKRASMLNRVERFIDDRKHKSERKHSGTTYRINKQYVKKPEDSDSDDGTYVFVNPSISPDQDGDITSDVDVPLPILPAGSTEPPRISRISGVTLPSVVKSEIQGVYSDDEGESLKDSRPHTDAYTYRGHPYTLGDKSRFVPSNIKDDKSPPLKVEGPVIVTQKRTSNRNMEIGKLCTFYRNNDENFKGLSHIVSKYPNLTKLMDVLNTKISVLPYGIKFIYPLPDGPIIRHIEELEHNRSYIVCGDKNPIRRNIRYGFSKEKAWVTKPPSASRIRKSELAMYRQEPNTTTKAQGRVITIYDNMNRNRKEKVILNPQTEMTFEQILSDMGDMFKINGMALYMLRDPSRKVRDYPELFSPKFRNVDDFILCGPEMVPVIDSSGQKRTAPSSNSSNESVGGVSSRQKKMQRSDEFDENEETDSVSPVQDDSMRWEQNMLDHVYPDPVYNGDFRADCIKMKIKGKMKEYFEPSTIHSNYDPKPKKKLRLEWLYGIPSTTSNGSLMIYHLTGELVCYADSVVVFYNSAFDSQRHYLAHTEEVMCMAIHPDGKRIATGQKAGEEPENAAHIRIWDGRSLSTHYVIGVGIFSAGVASVNFCVDGKGTLLCALDSSEKHVLTVWDWSKKRLLAKTTTSTRRVSNACFYPTDDTLIVTYGDQHLFFWKLFWDKYRDMDVRILRDRESGIFPDDAPREITAIAFSAKGDVITGDTSGSLCVWSVSKETFVFRYNSTVSVPFAHNKTITSLCLLSDEITLLSGGGDQIKAWDTRNDFDHLGERMIRDSDGYVTTILPQIKDNKKVTLEEQTLYVGTRKSCILEGTITDKLTKLVGSHYDAVWTLVAHPRESYFYSASYDGTVKMWSADEHKLIWSKALDKNCTCIHINKHGTQLAVGTSDGYIFLLGAQALSRDEIPVCHKVGPTAECICCVKFSPDRDMLAVGLYDGCVYIFNDAKDTGEFSIRRNTIFKANEKPVVQIDWSDNSHYIQDMSDDCDLYHWDVTDMLAKRALSMRDVEWDTYTCTVGYPLVGIWSNLKEKEEVRLSVRNVTKDYIAVGDSMGRIRLYKFPCLLNRPEYKSTRVYSSEVTALCFMYPQSRKGKGPDRLISCGGQRSVLAQWTLDDT